MNILYKNLFAFLLVLGVANYSNAQSIGANCPGVEDASIFGCSGTIYDTGGPGGNYSPDEFFRYSVCSDDGSPISVTLNYDFNPGTAIIEIFDEANIYENQPGGQNTQASIIYTGSLVARTVQGTGTTTYTSTIDCFTFLFLSTAEVTVASGFDLTWTSTGASCAANTANPNHGDGANTPGPSPNNGSSASNDFCGTPAIYDGTVGAPGATYNNVNSTSGAGVGANGCDPDPSNVDGQSTLETTVYFQYCATGGELFVDAGVNDCAGGGACVGFNLYKTADGGGTAGNACFSQGGLVEIAVGTDLNAGDALIANTCYIVIADGLAGATCDFCSYFQVQQPAANDECVNATPLECGVTLTGETNAASTDSGDALGCTQGVGVWYTFTATVTDNILVEAANATFDHELAVASATSCAGPFTNVACQDGFINGTESTTIAAVAGTTYYVYISGFDDNDTNTGTFDMTISGPGCVAPPCVPDAGTIVAP